MILRWQPWPDPLGLTQHMEIAALADGSSVLVSYQPQCDGWGASMRPAGGRTMIVHPDGRLLPMRERNVHWYATKDDARRACEKAVERRTQ